jgi:hypothetical protein
VIYRALKAVVVLGTSTALEAAPDQAQTVGAQTAETSHMNSAPTPSSTAPAPIPAPAAAGQLASALIANQVPLGMPDQDTASITGHISAAIAAGLPKFEPLPRASSTAAAATKHEEATTGITSLSAYIVRDSKIPTEDQILTYEARADITMNKYLGPSDGLDRGILNRYTLQQLWQKIPLLGTLPFVGTPAHMSNEDRGFDAGGANDTIPYPHPPPKAKDGSDEIK